MTSTAQNPYYFDMGIYRPPSEGGAASLLLRLTRNCPWNHCTFCAMYKTEKFELRKPAEIIHDISVMQGIALELRQLSEDEGITGGTLTRNVVSQFFKNHPDLYFHDGIAMLINWLAAGARTVFLQDADSLIMKTDDMIEVLEYLKSAFPTIERITTYARSRTIARKPAGDLSRIRAAGLSRVHIGLESGDETLLKLIKKGATPEDHVKGGLKALEAGFQVSEYWMPGLGGDTMSHNHAVHTAEILNQINPHYIRSRPFSLRPGSPMFKKQEGGRRMVPVLQLEEVYKMIDLLEVTSKVCFDHAGNYWKNKDGNLLLSHSYEGYKFPDDKPFLMDLLQQGINHYREK